MSTSRPDKAILITLMPIVFVLLWSAGYSVAKVGLQYAEPMTLLVWRYFLVIVLLTPIFLIANPRLPTRFTDWVHIAIVGVLVQAVYFGMSWFAFSQGVSAGVLAIIMSIQPILTAILAPKIVNESVGWRQWLGLIFGLAGVLIVILARSSIQPPTVKGMIFSVFALVGITSGVFYEKRFGLDHHPVIANLVQYTAGLAVVFPLAFAFETMQVNWNFELFAALAYLVIGNSILAISLLLLMIRMGEVSRVSALMFLVPPIAALFGWVLLGEEMPAIAWLGMVIAALGVLMATRKHQD